MTRTTRSPFRFSPIDQTVGVTGRSEGRRSGSSAATVKEVPVCCSGAERQVGVSVTVAAYVPAGSWAEVQLQSPEAATRVSQSVDDSRRVSPSRVTTTFESGMPEPTNSVAPAGPGSPPGAGDSTARGKASEAVFASVSTSWTGVTPLGRPDRKAWTSTVWPAYDAGTVSEKAPFSSGES
jgi:hypothetical protein